ncbi:hypothetical protein [Nocardia callitridis]|uniref:Uncharacterized protein n=1 Tax=Nocardia callitridis TaxID=648753 RepID=A0ABP9K2K9_9NOCA
MVAALSGVRVRLSAPDGTATAVLVSHLVGSSGFAIVGEAETVTGPGGHPIADLQQRCHRRTTVEIASNRCPKSVVNSLHRNR